MAAAEQGIASHPPAALKSVLCLAVLIIGCHALLLGILFGGSSIPVGLSPGAKDGNPGLLAAIWTATAGVLTLAAPFVLYTTCCLHARLRKPILCAAILAAVHIAIWTASYVAGVHDLEGAPLSEFKRHFLNLSAIFAVATPIIAVCSGVDPRELRGETLWVFGFLLFLQVIASTSALILA